jgi:hypothetical protein
MQRQWDPTRKAFRCAYTGISLSEVYGGRRYATWEHVAPGDATTVVLVADIINKMKNDMSEEEFRTLVRALVAANFDPNNFDANAFPPERLRS